MCYVIFFFYSFMHCGCVPCSCIRGQLCDFLYLQFFALLIQLHYTMSFPAPAGGLSHWGCQLSPGSGRFTGVCKGFYVQGVGHRAQISSEVLPGLCIGVLGHTSRWGWPASSLLSMLWWDDSTGLARLCCSPRAEQGLWGCAGLAQKKTTSLGCL